MTQFWQELRALGDPEYRARHLFTAKFRMLIFLGFWFLYVLLLRDELSKVNVVTATIGGAFICTIWAYYLIIMRGEIALAMIVEILADATAITAVVYLTGGISSDYFTLYVLYTLTAGGFYNYRLSFMTAIVCFLAYMVMFAAMTTGLLQPLALSFSEGHHYHYQYADQNIWLHPVLLGLALFIAVYVAQIAHHFTKRRERMLEEKNRELAALHQMSNTIRSASPLDEVVGRVLASMMSGLDFTMCLLFLIDRRNNRLICYPPKKHPQMKRIEAILGFPMSQLTLPLENLPETAMGLVQQKQVVFKRNLHTLLQGVEPVLPNTQLDEIQGLLGVQVMVGMPLVVDNEVIGACLGLSAAPYIEEHIVTTLEAFANQAALALQTTMMIRELVEANRVKSEFLATMSHELRTPLTAIIGFSELLLEGVMGEMTTEQRDSLREVLNNGNSLLDLINNLLDLAKVESGKMGLNHYPFSLLDLVDRLRRNLWPLIQRKELQWETVINSDLPLICADEKRMQQVLLNLISNAIKFTPDKGNLTVTVRHTPRFELLSAEVQARFPANARTGRDYFTIALADSGIGIAQANQDHIFEMFKQVDSSVTRRYEGTGLGLALAKQLVELHGGVIWVDSELGRGAKFTCVVPSNA